jgi:ferredoxin
VAAGLCALLLAGPPWLAGLVPSLSLFNALLAVAAGAGELFMLGAVVIAVACMFAPRLFCRWMCPAGTCQDAVSLAVRRRRWTGRVPKLGVWLVFVGLGAALAGYPLFGWLDPLVLFNAAFGLAQKSPGALDWAAAAGLPALLVLALVAPGLWCGRLCPLGALQDLVRFPLRGKEDAGGGAAREDACRLERDKADPAAAREKEVAAVGRRVFLGLGLGAGYRLALPPGREAPTAVIRPPASGSSARFTRLCARCGACVRACPSQILRFGGVADGWAGVLAPEASFEDDYCLEGCTACGQACPTGAIPKFTPQNKYAQPMGVVNVDFDRCVLGINRECGVCVRVCPYEALDLEWDPVEMVSRVKVIAKRCTGCGYCEYVCVTTPRSIVVKPLRDV